MNIDRRRGAPTPGLEPVEVGFRKHRRLDPRNEFREGADVDADCMAPNRERLYERGAAAYMVVEHQVARLSKRLNGGPGKGRRKAGWVLIKAVRETPYRLGIARTGDQRSLQSHRELEQRLF